MSRWNQILIWTGAALSWGTALVAVRSEPTSTSADVPADPQVEASTASAAVFPDAPGGGLVILRFTPVAPPSPVTQRVYVQAPAVAASGSSTQAAPSPSSSGS